MIQAAGWCNDVRAQVSEHHLNAAAYLSIIVDHVHALYDHSIPI